jgi:hypothetical protein
MKCAAIVTSLLLTSFAIADDVLLKDGKSIEFRILKDAGETIELQTIENKTITIAKKDIREVRFVVPKSPLTGATFVGDDTKGGKPANLLAVINPKENGSSGEWRIASGALVGGGLLEVPHIPVGNYDVELILERKEGKNEINIGLVAEGKPFAVTLDWSNGECTGLSAIDGRRVYENETRTNGAAIPMRKAVRITCAVRKDLIVLLIDGREHLRWKGELKRLSHPSRPDKNQNLFFGVVQSTVSITRFVVTPRE